MKKKRPKSAAFVPGAARIPLSKVDDRDEVKERYLDQVRECYVQERTRWESLKAGRPVEYFAPRSYDGAPALTVDGDPEATVSAARPNVWSDLYEALRKHNIDPIAYVRLVFSMLQRELARAPEPQQLVKSKYLDLWTRYKDRIADQFQIALNVENDLLRRNFACYREVGVSPEISHYRILLNKTIPLSPLLRYCVARHLNSARFDKVAEKFKDAAMDQYMRHPDQYRSIWGRLIPADFHDLVVRTYPILLA
jgi:hypothetical protein